jgi:murein DD-endopeptidase MepM/ murein hydrolase activator NlpD
VPTPAPAASPAGSGNVHVVAAGDTLSKIAHRYHKSVNEIAKANNIQPTATLTVGDRLTIPGAQASPVKASTPAPSAQAAPAKPVASAAPKGAEPVQNANVVAPTDQLDKEAAKLAEGTGAVPKFRWPANGRVIAGYGPTTNGQQNDGINIALPENTPVKAAEDGVVAYAGNELKGYGNLVLVRHPNGYVTAYAHTKELLVKRGDQVKRGQVIARSGQTGNVNAPQLHFEIRKGASPLDPTRFLNGA